MRSASKPEPRTLPAGDEREATARRNEGKSNEEGHFTGYVQLDEPHALGGLAGKGKGGELLHVLDLKIQSCARGAATDGIEQNGMLIAVAMGGTLLSATGALRSPAGASPTVSTGAREKAALGVVDVAKATMAASVRSPW